MSNKIQKSISTATVTAFLVVTVAQPITTYAAAQQQDPQYQQIQQQQAQQIQQVQQQQQNFQQQSSSNNTNQSRQIVYDTVTGQLITLVQNNTGQIFAYTQSGEQVEIQQKWLNNISGEVLDSAGIDIPTSSISKTKAAQLSTILSTIKEDSSLNAIGKIAKALLALEAIKENNQIIRQQYLAQQKAKAQAEQEQKIQQMAQEQKNVVKPKQSASTNTPKGEQEEYGNYLRDSAEETGGTTMQVTLNYSPSVDTQQDARETPLPLDLIGKVAGVNGNTITLQDAKGQQIDVDAPESGLQQGDYINVNGTALSGVDGNIYIVKDPESGIDVSINKISQEEFNQKATEQEQAANEFTEEEPASEETSYAGPSAEDSSSWFDGVKSQAEHLVDNWTWGKTASVAAVAGGAGLVAASGVVGFASYGAAAPEAVAMFKVGTALIAGGVGTLAVQDFAEEAQEAREERNSEEFGNSSSGGKDDIRAKVGNLMQEVDSRMQNT